MHITHYTILTVHTLPVVLAVPTLVMGIPRPGAASKHLEEGSRRHHLLEMLGTRAVHVPVTGRRAAR